MRKAALEDLVRREKKGAAALFLAPLSLLYRAGVALRSGLYAAGVARRKRLPVKVVSVGNLTAGGGGKTPVTIFLASLLKKKGVRTAVLTRGYGGRKKGVVSDGESVFMDAHQAGDEPLLMARRLRGVPVVAGPDRYRWGMAAVERFSPEVVILDDGFQHLGLERDLDILLVDSATGFDGGRLLPMGLMREPASAAGRADLVMVKGGGLGAFERRVVEGYGKPVVHFHYRPLKFVDLADGKDFPFEIHEGTRAVLTAGIAEPGSFFRFVREKLKRIEIKGTLAWPDHHDYGPADVEAISKRASEVDADVVLTTEKDGVKLEGLVRGSGRPRFLALSIDVVVDEADVLDRLLGPVLNAGTRRKV